MGGLFVTINYLYELRIRRVLILAYYFILLITASAKISFYGWCVLDPIKNVDTTIFDD